MASDPSLMGALMALVVVAFGVFVDFGGQFLSRPTRINTFVVLLVPMISCGFALLAEKQTTEEEDWWTATWGANRPVGYPNSARMAK
ncbi:MAG TPA: hypothetical protein VJ997_11990 [Longimicrobiales bacterium]|nr:hypothetical protein [Longimicrobiales bacterium]